MSCSKIEEDSSVEPSSQIPNTTESIEEQSFNTTEITEEQPFNATDIIVENELINTTRITDIVEEIPNKIVFARKFKNRDDDATTIFFIDNEGNIKFYYSITDTSFDINDPEKYISTLEELGEETIIDECKMDALKYCYTLSFYVLWA